jgi:small-conductance mechanosensitive channel
MLAILAQTPLDSARDVVDQSRDAMTGAFEPIFNQLADFGPKAVAALAVIIVGYIVSKLAAKLTVTVAEKLSLQRAAERGGLVESMNNVGIRQSVPALMGTIVFWMLMCVFFVAMFQPFSGSMNISAAMSDVLRFIPNVLSAIIVVVVGFLAANLLRGIVATSADKFGLGYASNLASACYYVVVLLTLIAAFAQLKIEFGLLNYAILIVLGGLALAFGLAVGFGGRDVVAGILAGYYLRQRLQAGDTVQVGNMEGVIRDVGPVATIIETEEHGLMNRHSVPNTKMLHEAVR